MTYWRDSSHRWPLWSTHHTKARFSFSLAVVQKWVWHFPKLTHDALCFFWFWKTHWYFSNVQACDCFCCCFCFLWVFWHYRGDQHFRSWTCCYPLDWRLLGHSTCCPGDGSRRWFRWVQIWHFESGRWMHVNDRVWSTQGVDSGTHKCAECWTCPFICRRVWSCEYRAHQ